MMKKWIALLLMAALLLCSVSALANTEINWADVEENAYEIDPNGEFWTLSDLGLQMWIPSVFGEWTLTDEQIEKGFQFVFATDDDAAEVWCKYVAYDGSLEDMQANLSEDPAITGMGLGIINGYEALAWTDTDDDLLHVVFLTNDDHAIDFQFWPISDEGFQAVAMVMASSIQ